MGHLVLGLLTDNCSTALRLHQSFFTMDISNKDEFIFFMKRAVEDSVNDSYIELYNVLLRAFAKADVDYDGKVSEEEFPGVQTAAASLPSKFGFGRWGGNPSELFKKIDDNGDGAISFDEWLSYAMQQYKAEVAALPKAAYEMEKDDFISWSRRPKTRQLPPTSSST